MTARYAIYFAPWPDEPLARFGVDVLGYDAESGTESPQIALPGIPAAMLSESTREPRLYGFHATLKAPFELARGSDELHLREVLAARAKQMAPFALDLRLAAIGGFVALVPASPNTAIQTLESQIVEDFERFRAPLAPADLARRLSKPLNARQKANLARYGYPYVKEEFRFHMTLTGNIGADEQSLLLPALQAALGRYTPAPRACVTSLALFRQESRQARFRVVDRFALGLNAIHEPSCHRSVMREA